jgi:hypothetical protein
MMLLHFSYPTHYSKLYLVFEFANFKLDTKAYFIYLFQLGDINDFTNISFTDIQWINLS